MVVNPLLVFRLNRWILFSWSNLEWDKTWRRPRNRWGTFQRIHMNKELLQIDRPVVYFNQWMGALHTIRWSKSFVFALKLCFLGFLFFFLFPFVMQKDGKTCFNAETNDFNQQMACGAPVLWSKYTTQSIQLFCKKLFYYLDTCLWSLFNLSLLRYKTNELQNLSVKEFK